MNIPLKMNPDFEKAMQAMDAKYGEDFQILNGFHESQLNFSDFIDNFIDKNVADATIDANANASNKDIRSMQSEKTKPHDKLFAFNKIFYEMKKRYNLRTAKEWLECEHNGAFYLHDASTATYMPYCYAYDLTRLATEGLFFLKNYNNQPPNHLTTFIDDVIEYISYMSNRSSGAVGIPNILIWTYYFWKKDCKEGYFIKDPEYYIRQSFQKLIYRLNQPFMRIDQTAFVNVSIFDRNYVESLFGGVQYPDGTYVIDEVESIIEHQKIFMEVVSDIRSENMFTLNTLKIEAALAKKYKYQPLPDDLSQKYRNFYLENIPAFLNVNKTDTALSTACGTPICNGYDRIVIGDYGAFIEFSEEAIASEFVIQPGQEYRVNDDKYKNNVKYIWLTTKDQSGIKIYKQRRGVKYADYKPNRYYVSVHEVAIADHT